MWSHEPDDTLDIPVVTDAEAEAEDVPGWEVAGARSLDGSVTITILPLTADELSGQQPA